VHVAGIKACVVGREVLIDKCIDALDLSGHMGHQEQVNLPVGEPSGRHPSSVQRDALVWPGCAGSCTQQLYSAGLLYNFAVLRGPAIIHMKLTLIHKLILMHVSSLMCQLHHRSGHLDPLQACTMHLRRHTTRRTALCVLMPEHTYVHTVMT
jgi:hypothetical protein